jgi:glycosyltransferase involved in cell wall biosynthesis
MKAIVERYEIGQVTSSLAPKKLALAITEMLEDAEKISTWKTKLQIAAKELTWENEEKVLKSIYESFLD